jgi:hypothetical protein
LSTESAWDDLQRFRRTQGNSRLDTLAGPEFDAHVRFGLAQVGLKDELAGSTLLQRTPVNRQYRLQQHTRAVRHIFWRRIFLR